MASTLEVSVRQGGLSAGPGESLVVALEGELDISTAPQLAARTGALLGTEIGQILVDVSELTFVDVGGLRALMAFRARAKQQLTAVQLVGASAHMLRVLGIVSPVWDFPPRARNNAEPATGRPPA